MEWLKESKYSLYLPGTSLVLKYEKMLGGFGWQLRSKNQNPGDCIAVNFDISPNSPAEAVLWADVVLEEKRPESKFWIIWNPTGAPPMAKHTYLHEAKAEAERLAARHKGQTFYVLRVVGKAIAGQPIYTEIEPTAFDRKELKKV